MFKKKDYEKMFYMLMGLFGLGLARGMIELLTKVRQDLINPGLESYPGLVEMLAPGVFFGMGSWLVMEAVWFIYDIEEKVDDLLTKGREPKC